ncbi:MAG: hypothetical protein JXB34_05665 [Bacteroidales bacterium]|nr:hypothetical protein [Bacteroidales bacterium]
MKYFVIFFLAFLVGRVNIYPAIYPKAETMFFSSLTQKQGLPHNNIECIFKDSDGFMWFGTRYGLCRYDGYDFTVFRSSADTNSISGDRILSIAEDNAGNIWVGTYRNGLNKYNKKTGMFKRYGFDYSISDRINRIKVLSDGSVWICSSYGLACYVPGTDNFKVYRAKSGNPLTLSSNYIYDIIETSNGAIYVASESPEIHRFDKISEEFTAVSYQRFPDLKSNYRKRIVEDGNGVLWIAANVHGLCAYNPETGQSKIFRKANNQLSGDVLSGDMAIDPDGNLWVCTDGGGINILNTNTLEFSYIRSENGQNAKLSSDHVYTVYFDDKNIAWIGTFGDGINYFDPARHKFNSFLFMPGDLSYFSNKSILSLYQDHKNRIWVGTDGNGLYMFDNTGKLHRFYHQPDNYNSLTTNVITSINEDSNGNILIGTYSGGLISFNPESGKFTRFNETGPTNKLISSVNVWRIYPDSRERIWLGMLGTGVDLFDPGEKTFVNYGPNSPKHDRIGFQNVMAILEDSDGDIWFGTEGRGFYILKSGTSKMYRINPDSVNNVTTYGIIRCIFQDKFGFIWIGTEGDGLYKYEKKANRLTQYTVADGLPSNIIQSLYEDTQENLWLGTANGLATYNTRSGKIMVFIEDDGLSGNEFNQNALIQLSDGRFMAGTTKGIDVFWPGEISVSQTVPKVVFTKLEILNDEILPGEKVNDRLILTNSITFTNNITLTYKEKNFAIEFAALNYTLPEKCQYQYILEGFDETWNTISSKRRVVSYSNLEPGNYTLRVKATNNDGVWGNNERVMHIKVLPPFYKTWWFRSFVVLFVAGLIYLLYSYRLNIHKNNFRQKQIEQERKIINLEKEKLESELQKLTFHVLNRNRALIDQKNRLMGLSMKAREVVRVGLQDIITKIDEELTDDKDWIYIEPQLDKVYNNFVTKLREKHPDLTLSEIKIAAYVRMDLSTKEISEFMHKTTRAVENDRYRLRKKIGLDTNESLQQYLADI